MIEPYTVVPPSLDMSAITSFPPAVAVIVGAEPPGQIVPAGQPRILNPPALLMVKTSLAKMPDAGQPETAIEALPVSDTFWNSPLGSGTVIAPLAVTGA